MELFQLISWRCFSDSVTHIHRMSLRHWWLVLLSDSTVRNCTILSKEAPIWRLSQKSRYMLNNLEPQATLDGVMELQHTKNGSMPVDSHLIWAPCLTTPLWSPVLLRPMLQWDWPFPEETVWRRPTSSSRRICPELTGILSTCPFMQQH